MDCSPHSSHQVESPGDIVQTDQTGCSRLTDLQEVPDVAPTVPFAHFASAIRVDRRIIEDVTSILQVQFALRSQCRSVSTEACLQHTVELIDTEGHRFHERCWIADAHQISRPIAREDRGGSRQSREHLLSSLAHRQSPDAVSIEIEFDSPSGTLPAQVLGDPALNDSEKCLIGPFVHTSCPSRPCRRSFDSPANHPVCRRQSRTDVEHHLDIGSQFRLNFDR
jgi:hypothetical protein